MTTSPFFYCSELSRAVAERPFGTASVGEVWMLLEYTQQWNSNALEGSTLPPEVKAYLNKILKSVPRSRLLLIKQERAAHAPFSFFIVRSREREPFIVEIKLNNYDELLNLDVLAAASGKLHEGQARRTSPLYLVCTHGKRDKCCAKFGYALYKSLHATHGEAVWQSSHVGGDRFAANLICFPHGVFYAHMNEETGRAAVEEYAARRLVLERYRGRACYAYPVQAAEYYVRVEAGLRGTDELRLVKYERRGEGAWLVSFAARGGERVYEATINSRPSEFSNFITCHAEEPKRVVQYVLADLRATDAHALTQP